MKANVPGRIIEKGYPWSVRLKIATTPGLFPAGVELTGHVKAKRGDASPLAVLTTEGGQIVRVSDTEVDITIPGDVTGTFPVAANAQGPLATVTMDFVRTDTAEPEHLQFALTVPVQQPVTLRGAL